MRHKIVLVAVTLAILGCDPFGALLRPRRVFYPAAFTPDGSGLVISELFGRRCFLYHVDIATGATRRVTSATSGCEVSPTFSPDGQHLAYLKEPTIGEQAYIMEADTDGTGERVLVTDQSYNLTPRYVPHSNKLVFLRSASFERSSPAARPRRHKYDVYAVDLTTREITRLTHKEYYDVYGLSVSADGQQLLISLFDDHGDNIVITSIDSAEKPIMRLRPQPFAYVTLGTWLPDGHSLLFAGGVRHPGGDKYDYNVYRLTIATGDILPLTQFTGTFSGLHVAPDGTKAVVLYQGAYYVIDLKTQQVTKVPLKL